MHKQQYKFLPSRSIELPGVIGAATTAIKLPVILVAGRGRSIAAPFLVGGRWASTARAVAHPVLYRDADHVDDALEGVAGDPGPERHGRVLVPLSTSTTAATVMKARFQSRSSATTGRE